jgi:hypothetical protein
MYKANVYGYKKYQLLFEFAMIRSAAVNNNALMANFEASMPPAWTLCSINPNNSLVFF